MSEDKVVQFPKGDKNNQSPDSLIIDDEESVRVISALEEELKQFFGGAGMWMIDPDEIPEKPKGEVVDFPISCKEQ